MDPPDKVRLDRWLWAARFFKTRAQAKIAIEGGKVHCFQSGGRPGGAPGGEASEPAMPGSGSRHRPKVSKEIAVGEMLEISRGRTTQVVEVTGLAEKRGTATQAAELYRETPESIELRETERARRRMENAGLRVPQRRPGKRDRRELARLKQAGPGDAPAQED
ncbi:MAG: RNA-binding protein [Gammaproteobacteria bacterium]|nr:RNA-binding protein [Gammaproteobacteria bacterium]|tara:strand:+ start:5230 stop:5718 length:489 start_codon:yes stop_codon:yes gene_type:complete